MQSLEQAQLGQLDPALKTHHGSLDRLLQQQEKQLQLAPQQQHQQLQQRPSASAVHSMGGVIDGGGSGALLGSADSDGDGDDEKEPELPPRPPSRIKSQTHVRHIKEEFDRGVEVEKFYHQINGDIFEITRRVRARDEDTIEQKVIKRKGSVRLPPEPPPRQASAVASTAAGALPQVYRAHGHGHVHQHHVHRHGVESGKPQLPPRRQKSAEEVPVSKSTTRAPEELEWFDRKAQQRHSARSAESGAVREETIEWLARQRGPVRTSSGPSEITVMKDEVPDWLLEHLPRKRSMVERPTESKTSAASYAKALKEELAELLKKPLSRQSSAQHSEFSLLKTDIVEWLTKLQTSSRSSAREEAPPPKTRRAHHRRNGSGDTQRSHSQEDATVAQQAARKRHSLGHSDRSEEEMLDWIAYPLNRLQSLGKPPPMQQVPTMDRRQPFVELHHKPAVPPLQSQLHQQQPICAERERRSHERSRERKLRHSASEVVTAPTTSAAAQSQLERLYAKPHKERYQYVPKDAKDIMLPPKESAMTTAATSSTVRESKRERSRRHQTQRSATVSDMSGHHNGGLKRKSSSAERAPRSPSPCNDPACRLLPICTDPHCRFLECQTIERGAGMTTVTTSASTINLARHQQVARAQMHTVPAHITSDDTPTPPPPPPPTSQQQQQQQMQQFQSAPQRRLVICHECRSCAPLLTCQNRKCFNAAKCNSLPRSAADFNRLRTTLAQPPTTLDDIEPAPETPSPQMPRHPGMQYRSNSQPNTLQRGDSAAALWQQDAMGAVGSGPMLTTGMATHTILSSSQPPLPPSSLHITHAANGRHYYNGRNGNGMSHLNGTNGKLMKSASAASLNSRRRRHKTVHFGENLLREVCQNRKLIKTEQVPSGSAPMKANIQMLYNFVEGVLSAWVDDDEEQVRSGAESEPEQGTMALKPIYRCNRLRYQCIKRIVEEAAELHGTLKLGNSRYRHRHWRSTAKQCNEMFLRKISDDDRMSLTTAVSDEDDGESVMASPYKAKATGTAASSFNCTGAVRKAGFLSVKKWLLRKKHQIELARKRGWKGYWVCLKGTTLLFYPCDSREGRSVEAAPKHLIIVDGAIMQPIPEHPKRDYIFCLSTAFGDAYLFQAPCQVELENWVNSIHSACAAAFARHRGKTGTLHLLQEEIFRLEKAIESDHKLKHMAELQQSVVTDQDTRHQIQTQILQWEENLERLHCEQFRLRCYMASLQSGELPNPKSLLTHVSRPTKNTLNKLGVFTVSSFHAFICARSPSLLNNLLAGRGATKRRPPMLSRSNSGSSRRSMQMNSRDEPEKTFKVAMPDNAYATVYLRDAMSVEEFLASACARRNLNPMEHFVRVKKRRDMEDHNYFVPHRNDLIENYLHNHEFVEVCMKILYQVELHRTTLEQMWGFSVEAELIENAERQDELCCYVSRVEDKSVAMQNGIIKGDEIMVINAAIVSDLDMMYLESVLQEEQSLCMMMRSSRTEPPDLVGIMRVTDDMIDSLVCPPPPSDPPVMSEEMISGLIVPAPGWNGTGKDLYSPEAESSPAPSSVEPTPAQMVAAATKPTSRTSSFEIENLLKTAEQVTGFCRSPQETRKSSPTGSVTSSVSNAALTPSRQLTDAEKLRKVILELVDTERTYVKHLNNLLEHYLEPMKRETFLSNAEINALFGNIHEIVTFQRQFLQNLEEALELEPDFHNFEHSSQFRNVLFAIGSAFLYYVNHFKLYSSFCASHSKAQKVLHPNEGNHALQEFLAARNPKQQHSSTLESYLIKPIQRILKYPLLLQQLRNLTDSRADEHLHLCEALKGMEKVAEHINEMQRIHEEYGAIFDHLFRQHQKSCKQPIDLSPDHSFLDTGDLLYYGGVEWLNISDFLGKIKKGLELHAMCFVFKSAVVFLCKERLRQKKKLMGVSSKNAPNEVEIIRYQVLIPVTEVQVRASSAKDMDSHFLWELIHLRSQLQRRSEKVYVLSNSTADFRNAFLKTIRQIIRESVRNMSIPMKGFGSSGSVSGISSQGGGSGSSQTLERPKQQITIIQGSQTLGKPKKKSGSQRHSAGNIDYDNLSGSQEADDVPMLHHQHQQQQLQPSGFRGRSKTVGDATELMSSSIDPQQQQQQQHQKHMQHHQQQQMHHHHQQMHQSDIERMDPGTKSEGEEDSQQGTIKAKATLGRTPNHLTLSTTSTLSVGSTGSQARLIQSSHPPSSYQPVLMKDLGKTNSITNELSSSPQAEYMDAAGTVTVSSLSAAMEATDQMMFMIEEMGIEVREMDEQMVEQEEEDEEDDVDERQMRQQQQEEMDYILESELQAASVAAAFNLSLGSPVWKPRDMINLGDAQSTTRKDDANK
ncbi:protein still life, isoforms C/SIF type 2 isoform X2 [Bactrocera dorsalis]|uniref:Protein still life, isoforms C/SIF type 2 isoform X2 n=1 Tax=Bactrocera dorsalis TaxID=27457 RepID=A0ABM3JXJ0_BACDO|nr:protein still life, isoforms C/SIF type 2 isoform X2 [Bactrocera dorsalis]